LDAIAESFIRKSGAKPTFIGYRGYPATLCISINEEVVHGIPGKRKLKSGDIVSVDVAATLDGFVGDTAMTVLLDSTDEKAKKLVDVTRESLEAAIRQMRPGQRLGDIGAAVQRVAESNGFGVVRDFVGHGIGRQMHEEPSVPNYGTPGTGIRLEPGMVLAVEPMVTMGHWDVKVLSDGWTVVTKDGSLAAHFEHTIAVTEDGPVVFTKIDEDA
jgi:methionyl aminopeptidase